MKQTRLLEIIREEISAALTEVNNVLVTNKKGETTTMPFNTPDEKKTVSNLKSDSNIVNIKTTAGQNIKEEEQLNEMAYDIVIAQPDKLAKLQDTIKDSTKKGEQQLAKALEIIQKTKKEGKPIRQRDIANEMGLIQQKINPLINKLIDVGILEKGESVKKPKAEPKTKTEKLPKAKPTTAPKAEPMDSEDAEAPAGDAEIERAARGRDELIKQFRDVMSTYKAKKENEGDQAAIEYLKSKQDIVKKYKKIQQVNV